MKKQALNPVLPTYEYVPDGEPYVFGDRIYVYGSHDQFNGDAFCMNDYVCWSAPVSDLSDWRFDGVIYRKEQDPRYAPGNCMYAPDITIGPDGRFYLYYTLDMTGTMSVAVGDSPVGPFRYYGRVQYPDGRVLGDDPTDVYQFDPGVLVDDDGKVWLYTGFGPRGPKEIISQRFGNHNIDGAFCVELEQDMITVKAEPRCIVPQFEKAAGTAFEDHPFFEASSIRKIGGLYYFVYSSTWCHELCYAVSKYPDRDFKAGGPIISNGDIGLEGWTLDRCANYIGNNHGGMVEVNGQWYIFYHRQTNYHSFSRQCCAEKIYFAADGSIPQVEMTSCGLNDGDLKGEGRYSAAHACQLYAAQGGTFMDRAAAHRQDHPGFTQHGADREEDPDQYITNMKNGSIAGFKYFDLRFTTGISVETKGSTGTLRVWEKPGHRLLAEIPVQEGAKNYAPLIGGTDHSALYFEAVTNGSFDFISFTLA